MDIPRLCLTLLALALAALLTFAGGAHVYAEGLEEDQPAPLPSVAETIDEARLLLAIGHFDEVLPVLRAHREAGSSDTDLFFLLGLASAGKVQSGQVPAPERQALLDEAVSAFGTVLDARPDYVRARIELATTFFLMEDDQTARRHFELALAEQLPSWVAEHIRLFLAKMDDRRR